MNDAETLAEFVRQSNAIEGIYAGPGDPLYDDHLDVANALVALGEAGAGAPSPGGIHAWLMQSQPSATPGEYRRVNVRVGPHSKMPWMFVPAQMAALLERVAVVAPDRDEELLCWAAHHEFEHIHPFIDGNGRTGRLWMNALRVARGLPWITVWERDRQAYYQAIRNWEASR